jgi:hypothetical protein
MFIVRHKIGRWASRVILTIICLSLLTAQASYKFYQFASAHPFPARHHRVVTGQANALKPIGPAVRSLDKRFDITHFFIVPVPYADISPIVRQRVRVDLNLPADLAHRSAFPALLRGPPLQIS